MSLFSRRAYDKLIAMTGKKVGCPYSLVSYSYISTDTAQYQGKSAMFFNACELERALLTPKIMRSKDAQCKTGE